MISRRLVLAGLAASAPAFAQPRQELSPSLSTRPVTTHSFQTFRFTSEDGRRLYRIETAIPRTAANAGGYPSLWLCDGNAAFMALTPADLETRPDLAFIALGYDAEVRFDPVSRAYDYTPAIATTDEARPEQKAGGADIMAALLRDHVLPEIGKAIGLDPARRALWGHSYGGLFTLNTLYRHAGLFAEYIPASPSLWWYEGRAFTGAPAPSPKRRVLLMMGDAEINKRVINGRTLPTPQETVAATHALAGRIATVHTIRTEILPSLGHGQMFNASLKTACTWAFSGK